MGPLKVTRGHRWITIDQAGGSWRIRIAGLLPDAAKTLGFSGVASVSSEMSARRRAMAVPND
jgi:hypothetical protein